MGGSVAPRPKSTNSLLYWAMEKRQTDHQKVLQDLDRMLDEAPDEASREEIRRLRNSLTAPEMIEMARAARKNPRSAAAIQVLEFHDPLLPSLVTATGGVIATAICLYAVALGFEAPTVVSRRQPLIPGSSRCLLARSRSLSPRCR